MVKLPANLKVGAFAALGVLTGTVVADSTSFDGLKSALGTLCTGLKDVLPVVSMLMVIGAGVVYAGGQMMGAETRARANTWATAMLVGAIIGILIVVVAPPVLRSLWGSVLTDPSICAL